MARTAVIALGVLLVSTASLDVVLAQQAQTLLNQSLSKPLLERSPLEISKDARGRRPAILLAWRNSNKVFEAEVGISNTSTSIHKAATELVLVDNEGRLLLRRPESGRYVEASIPGSVGHANDPAIVQLTGTREGNLLLDQLDRSGTGYTMIATVYEPSGAESAPVVAAKTFNIQNKARAGRVSEFEFALRNRTGEAGAFEIRVEGAAAQKGSLHWESNGVGSADAMLGPDEALPVFATFWPSVEFKNSESVDIFFSLVNKRTSEVVDKREWFLVRDDLPPDVTEHSLRVQPATGLVEVEVTASDRDSGIREASGVRIDYSTDGGITSSSRVLTYLDGDFIRPTRFFTALGPFAKKTTVDLWLTVTDTAGNSTRRKLPTVTVDETL